MPRMAGKVGPGVSVIPLLPIPVGGIGSETLIRDMMDLDSWIVSTGAGQATGLPDSRDTFWQVILEAGRGGGGYIPVPPPFPARRHQEPQDQAIHVRSKCGNYSG